MSRELGEIISSEVDRTNLLVTRFLDFARPLEPRRETADIAEIVDSAAKRTGVPIVREYSKEVPRLAIDPALMEQVFINLLSNAGAGVASPATPSRWLRVWPTSASKSTYSTAAAASPPDEIETSASPFVTTKSRTASGSGLAIVVQDRRWPRR